MLRPVGLESVRSAFDFYLFTSSLLCITPARASVGYTGGMSAVQRRKAGLFLAALTALALVFAGLAWRHYAAADPCETADREALVARYPVLADLVERQRVESERLLVLQREQDMAVNQELSHDRISPEEALRLSLNQVNEIAALRRMHRAAFVQTCREVTRTD